MPGPQSKPMNDRGTSRGRDWSAGRKVDIVHTIDVPVCVLIEEALELYRRGARENKDAIRAISHKVCRMTTHCMRYTGWQTHFNALLPRNEYVKMPWTNASKGLVRLWDLADHPAISIDNFPKFEAWIEMLLEDNNHRTN